MNTEKTGIKKSSRAEDRRRLRTVMKSNPSWNTAARKEPKTGGKLKVAVYRRTSPDDIEQLVSLRILASGDERKINTQPSCLYVGSYIDRGSERTAFERLMESARAGEVDRIVVKSMFMFADSVGGLLATVCSLRCLPNPVQVHFEAEDVTTGTVEWERCVCFLMSCLNSMYRKTGESSPMRTVEVG